MFSTISPDLPVTECLADEQRRLSFLIVIKLLHVRNRFCLMFTGNIRFCPVIPLSAFYKRRKRREHLPKEKTADIPAAAAAVILSMSPLDLNEQFFVIHQQVNIRFF